jgi:hypothetical protein
MAQYGRSDDVVEGLGRESGTQIVNYIDDSYVPQLFPFQRASQIVIEHGASDWVPALQNFGELFGPESAASAEFQYGFARQDVEAVAHRDSAPVQLPGRRRWVSKPVCLTGTLHLAEIG